MALLTRRSWVVRQLATSVFVWDANCLEVYSFHPSSIPFTTSDIGAVFGIGFPPFRGGPFRYIDALGAQKVVDVMNRYRDVLGEQFEPAPILKDYAKGNKKFHSD